MVGVVTGFAIIGVIIGAGYVVGRAGLLGESARTVLSRTVFFVAAPCLLFTVLAGADRRALFSPLLVVSALAGVSVVVISVAVGRLVWRRDLGQLTVAALSAGYVNANNIGLPVAVYVLGSAAYSAPVILFQLVLFAPAALIALDAATTAGRRSVLTTLAAALRNPLLIASALGAILAVLQVHLPTPVLEPFRLVGGAAVPLMLLGFGMSLHGQRVLEAASARRDVLLATGLKLVAMPIAAYVLGAFVFHLDEADLHATVVLAALPTAQNVLNYATRYDTNVILARDSVLLTTLGALPVLLVVSLVLAP